MVRLTVPERKRNQWKRRSPVLLVDDHSLMCGAASVACWKMNPIFTWSAKQAMAKKHPVGAAVATPRHRYGLRFAGLNGCRPRVRFWKISRDLRSDVEHSPGGYLGAASIEGAPADTPQNAMDLDLAPAIGVAAGETFSIRRSSSNRI